MMVIWMMAIGISGYGNMVIWIMVIWIMVIGIW